MREPCNRTLVFLPDGWLLIPWKMQPMDDNFQLLIECCDSIVFNTTSDGVKLKECYSLRYSPRFCWSAFSTLTGIPKNSIGVCPRVLCQTSSPKIKKKILLLLAVVICYICYGINNNNGDHDKNNNNDNNKSLCIFLITIYILSMFPEFVRTAHQGLLLSKQ